MKKLILVLFLSTIYHLASSISCYAADYYVSPGGFGSTCSNDAPCSLSTGYLKLVAGDNLYLKGGTYLLTSTLYLDKSGSATSRITYASAPKEIAIISGDVNNNGQADITDTPMRSPTDHYHLILIQGSFIDFRNLEVVYAGAHGLTSTGHNNLISGNTVHHIWGGGIIVRGANTIIENNTVWRTDETNYCNGIGGVRQCNGDWPGAIAWGDTSPPYDKSPNTIVRHNTVFHNSGEGLICMQTGEIAGGLVEDNLAYDNWALNLDLDQCSNYTIQRNLFYYTNDPSWWRGGTYPAHNLMVSNEGISDYPVISHNLTIINNILVGSNFRFWQGKIPSSLVNDLIAHNSIINTQANQASLQIDRPNTDPSGIYSHHLNSYFINNLVYQHFAPNSSSLAEVDDITGITFSHNFWSSTPPANVVSLSDLTSDPLLNNPNQSVVLSAVDPLWYQLTANSPAIHQGTYLTQVTSDFTSHNRGSTPSIGAFEYVAHPDYRDYLNFLQHFTTIFDFNQLVGVIFK